MALMIVTVLRLLRVVGSFCFSQYSLSTATDEICRKKPATLLSSSQSFVLEQVSKHGSEVDIAATFLTLRFIISLEAGSFCKGDCSLASELLLAVNRPDSSL